MAQARVVSNEIDSATTVLISGVAGSAHSFAPAFRRSEVIRDIEMLRQPGCLLRLANFPAEPSIRYPRIVNGARSCPPEDCGGSGGYADLLEILLDPGHEQFEHMRE